MKDFVRKHRSAVEKELNKGRMDVKAVLDCYRNPRVAVEYVALLCVCGGALGHAGVCSRQIQPVQT